MNYQKDVCAEVRGSGDTGFTPDALFGGGGGMIDVKFF